MAHRARKTDALLLPVHTLFRERLFHKLEEALVIPFSRQSISCKLVLLRAPAGYGKTTLLADFARRIPIPCGWYFLDNADTDLTTFLETFTAILCRAFPEIVQALPLAFLQELSTAIQTGGQDATRHLEAYIAALETHVSQPFILCLCDYHNIDECEYINVFLDYLLPRMPHYLALVIESRAVPSLTLAPLLARGQMLGLGQSALRFTQQEILAFAHLQNIPLSEEEAEQLAMTFDGWIVGILLATRLGNRESLSAVEPTEEAHDQSAISINPHMLFLHLRDEVFKKEPQAFTFLQNTSLLQKLTVQECNYLLNIHNAEELLTNIEKRGLFITRVNSQNAQPAYALHPVIRRLFYEEHCRTQGDQIALLHRRVAALFFSNNDYEQSILHAQYAQDYALVSEIIQKAILPGQPKQVEPEVIAQWIDALPSSVRDQQPHLLLIRANIYLADYQYKAATSFLEKAYLLVAQQDSSSDHFSSPTLLSEVIIVKCAILFQEGNYTETQRLCKEVLEHLSADEKELRILVYTRLALCSILLGNYTTGISQFHFALHLSEYHIATLQTAYIHSCLANSYSLLGNYALTEHHRNHAITLYETLNHNYGKINNLIWLAILKRNTGLLDEAETMLQDIIAMAKQEQFSNGEAYALFNLGANALDKNCPLQALTALEDSLKLARQNGDGRLANQCLCELVMVYLVMEEVDLASLFLEQTVIISTENTSYEKLEYDLMYGTLFLYQKNFAAALACFHTLESIVQKTSLKRVHIECLIRLAVCQWKLGLRYEMEVTMEKAVHIVLQGYFEHIPLIEFQRFPEMWQAVQRLPDKACLEAWRSTSSENNEESLNHLQDAIPDKSPSSAKIRIQAFGEPLVIINDVPITHWRLARSMEIFFFLVDYNRPIRKEQLIEALWPQDVEYVDQTFRSAIHYLRKVIGKSCITSQGGIYKLHLNMLYGADVWYDVVLFQQHYTRAMQELKAEKYLEAKEHLETMVELYEGDYVQSFYSNWSSLRRDELRRMYIDARRELARIAWQYEDIEYCISHWQNLLAIDQCSEEAHNGLMRCYIRQGKRDLAVRQFQRCTQILERELSISPGNALQKLYQRLISNSPQ